ncbi:MAG TPA: choice-of-anchor B family protein [Rubricoccaceae bacterium]|nr:choice-of-anchor B family protein [Rubricoccaceae bacterium]
MTTRPASGLALGAAVLALGLASAASAQPLPCTDGHAGAYACDGMDLISHVSLEDFGSGSGNDIWGWTDPETGREYALVGLNDGTGFVDVTDPAHPINLGKLPTATEPSIWRDIKVYRDHAFVVSEAPAHGMQVFDLTRLRGLDHDPARTFEADVTYTGPDETPLGSAHNIAINEESGFAYPIGAQECAGGLYMIDIREPLNPQFAGCFDEDGYSHDAQCVIYRGPDPDYQGREICVGSNEDTITIVDVTDKANPVQIAQGTYPTPGYTHQGWFTEDHRYFLADDELDEIQGFSERTRTMAFDLEDLDSPELLTIFEAPVGSADHNLYVLGDRVYQANYASGLRVLDISGIEAGQIRQVAFFDIYPETDDAQFNGAWSVYPYFASGSIVVSGIEGGLFVVRPTATTSLNLSRFDVTVEEGAADVTWVVERNSGEPLTLQRSHEGGPFLTVATLPATAAPEYHVEGLSPGRHAFRLVQLGADGRIQVSAAAEAVVAAPENFRVSQPYPGERGGTLRVAVTVAEGQQIRLDVVDGDGRRVKTVFDGTLDAGTAEAFEVFGEGLPSDTYTLQVTGETFAHEVALAAFDTSALGSGR